MDRLVAFHEQATEGWKELFRIEAAKTQALQDRLLSLKLEGATEPRPTGPLPVTIVPKSDELRDLIHERCGGDLRKRGMMLAQLTRDRADGVRDDDIRRRIEDGVATEGVPA